MRLKVKMSIAIALFFLVTFSILYFFVNKTFVESYVQLERIDALKESKKTKRFFEEKNNSIYNIVRDWAYWDDAYKYIENRNKEFEKINLNYDSMNNLGLNIMIYLDKEYNPIYMKSYDLETGKELGITEVIVEKIKHRKSNKGYLEIDDGRVMIFALSPVYNISNTKTNGYFGAGYIITEKIRSTLSEQLNSEITITGGQSAFDEENLIFYVDNNHVVCSWSEIDILRGGSIIFSIKLNRDTYNLGTKTLENVYFIFMAVFLFLIALLLIFMKIGIWNRLDKLTEGVKNITFKSRQKIKPLDLKGNDELTLLKDSINNMVQTIEGMTEKITKNEERYRALYEETAAIHILVDEYGIIKDTNKVILNVIQCSKDEFIGKNIRNVVEEHDADNIMNLISDIILGETGKSVEARFVKKDKEIATIILYSTSLLISEEDNTYSILLAGADITERKDMERKLSEFATIDAMTGVYNRRMGMDLLEKYMSMSERTAQPLTICFIDVNNLKKVNDLHGHNAGDDLIKDTAKILQKSIRDSDILCRLGGDEFLLIFPNCNKTNSNDVWERIVKNIENVNKKEKKVYTISISHGFAEYEQGMRIEYFIEMADNEMYEEKKRKKGLN